MRKTHHKYKVLVLVKDTHTGEVSSYETAYSNIRDMKTDIWYRYKVKKLILVSPELYQGIGIRYEVSVFVQYSY